jgi:hypothetical protein
VKIIPELLAEAVEDCITCDGSGHLEPPTASTVRWCYHCLGGVVLTTEGHQLVDFLTKWLTPKFAEVDHFHKHEHGI